MTAEICIMNRLAISLAADSAVTIGYGAEKIYTSAEKLFLLAENAPIGLMIYQSANLLDIPIETIIKIYRKCNGRKTFPSLQDYVDDFIQFLENERSLFPEEGQKIFISSFANLCFRYLKNAFEKQADDYISKNGSIQEKEIKKLFAALVKNELEDTKQSAILDNLPGGFCEALEDKYGTAINEIMISVFENLPMYKSTKRDLVQVIIENVTRKTQNGNITGVVIAGFGEKEHLPSLVEVIIKGIACNHVLCYEVRNVSIVDGIAGVVIPFAQKEMVCTFMEGIDPDLQAIMRQSISKLFHGVADEVIKLVKEDYPEFGSELGLNVSKNLDIMIQEFVNKWNKIREDRYSSPIMQIVAVLPKDELAAMAESLVNLTKFKRRVSMQKETVGGPIDVAVITKGDGFVWVKRKFYFDGSINPRFMARYTQGEAA